MAVRVSLIFAGVAVFALLVFPHIGFAEPEKTLLWNGETLASRAANHEYGVVGSSPYAGSYSFEGQPDPWHMPSISLVGQPSYRINLNDFDEIWFYAKSDIGDASFG